VLPAERLRAALPVGTNRAPSQSVSRAFAGFFMSTSRQQRSS
jgi:hypothetical protein